MADASVFDKIRIGIASPDDIKGWSRGEVKKPETINYRTFKPERDGLFCERIFGPVKDWECHCGRYKKVKFKGITCERCGVEVTRQKVRRERMGHIELAAPVCHIWYLKGVPSPLSLVLDISPRQLEKVIYFASFIVISVNNEQIQESLDDIRLAIEEEKVSIKENSVLELERLRNMFADEIEQNRENMTTEQIDARQKTLQDRLKQEDKEADDRINELDEAVELLAKLEKRQLIDEDKYRAVDRLLDVTGKRLGRDLRDLLRADIGAIAVEELLKEVDVDSLTMSLRQEVLTAQGTKRARAIKRLEIVEAFFVSRSKPDWMILRHVPVISPELRPMVQLDGGRFATSDLNDLYRRIINRNNRLRKIMEIHAPESIINHEKRLLQEAVDALLDNGRRSRPVTGSSNRPLKSLSDMLKGKEGRFRKNLLGKRVDYSGRSVIVVGPHLKLHQCGLPKEMALELFKPFVIKMLTDKGVAQNIKAAKKLIDRMNPVVWDQLETVIREHPVLLNRAPTLHRLGIQAFEPVLVDGKAIQVHPLVCHAYNADFDGDQMAVHVPLSAAAQAEARVLMLSTHNLFSPANGGPVVAPVQDIVLGSYYLTMADPKADVYDQVLASPDQALYLFATGDISMRRRINVRLVVNGEAEPRTIETTPGRLLLNEILPPEIRYSERYLRMTLSKKAVSDLVADCHAHAGHEATIRLLDELKQLGFRYATNAAISISMTDMDPPEKRHRIIRETEESARRLDQSVRRGLLNVNERKRALHNIWNKAHKEVGDAIIESIDHDNPLFIVTDSGARGSMKQVTQLAGMRGLMADPFGNLIEDLPVQSNFHEGLTVFEYFVSTHGARKGLADTALRTADAGYLTRRLVDVAQDVIIREIDCGTTEGIYVSKITNEGGLVETLGERLRGRTSLGQILDPETNQPFIEKDDILTDAQAARITAIGRQFDAMAEAGASEGTEARTKLNERFESLGFQIDEHQELTAGIRSTLTCELRQGVCAMCYGRDMATGKRVEIGVAVGIMAAQSIGEPGTQLTMRTFHTGGIAADNSLTGVKDVKRQRAANLRLLKSDETKSETQTATDEIFDVRGEQQRVVQQIVRAGGNGAEAPAPTSSRSKKAPTEKETDDRLKKAIRSWRQKQVKLLDAEIGGILRVEELFEARHPKGEAIVTEFDGIVTNIVKVDVGRWVVIRTTLSTADSKASGKFSAETIIDPEKGTVLVAAGAEVAEKMLARMREVGIHEVSVLETILVSDRVKVIVSEGDHLRASDRLTPGPRDPHKVLDLRGPKGVHDYLVREIQAVYKNQGVDINDKHVEVISRQMLRKRKIREAGDSLFLPGQVVDRFAFDAENERIQELISLGETVTYDDPVTGETITREYRTATADWVLLGITEASLATESFLSAASFQKTTRVLTDAAVRGKKDDLVGLKENVIIGRLIPAGTGFPDYRHIGVEAEIGAAVKAAALMDQEVRRKDASISHLADAYDEEEKGFDMATVDGSAIDTEDDEE